MQDIEPIIKDYLLAWNASDSKKRADLMAKVVAEDCLYADSHLLEPIVTRELHYQFIDRFRQKFPDLSLVLISSLDSHHNFFRFAWKLVKPDGISFSQGSFFGEVNQQGEISKLVGFVDK